MAGEKQTDDNQSPLKVLPDFFPVLVPLIFFTTHCLRDKWQSLLSLTPPRGRGILVLNKIEEMGSATFTQYVGHSREQVYLEYFSAARFGKNKTVVYWTEIDNLPDSIRTIIMQNKNPWVPWSDKNRQ